MAKIFFEPMFLRDIFLKSFIKSVGNTSGILVTVLLGWQALKISRKALSYNSNIIKELEDSEKVNDFLSDSVVKEEIKNFKVLFDKL